MGKKEEVADVDREEVGDSEFVLRGLGLSVSLSSVWRMPWQLYVHGSSFWFAYGILAITIAFPLLVMEAGLGQFMGAGPLRLTRTMLPALQGFGITSIAVNAFSVLFHGSMTSMAFFYTLSSFNSPWRYCIHMRNPHKWDRLNSPVCFTMSDHERCVRNKPEQYLYAKGKCYDAENVSQLVRDLSRCVLGQPGRHHYGRPDDKSSGHCTFRLHFTFNASSPVDFLDVSEHEGTQAEATQVRTICSKASDFWHKCKGIPELTAQQKKNLPYLIQEYHPCHGSVNGLDFFDEKNRDNHFRVTKNKKHLFVIDLAHHHSTNSRTDMLSDYRLRASCFAYFLLKSTYNTFCDKTERKGEPPCQALNETDLEAVRQLECALKTYCKATWVDEKLPFMECLRRTLDTQESYATEEHVQYFLGQEHWASLSWTYQTLLCFLLTWIAIGLVILKGSRFMVKLTYGTLATAGLLGAVLALMSLSYKGNSEGLFYAFSPDVDNLGCKLLQPGLWAAALAQILASVNLEGGALTTLASFNHFNNHILRDMLVLLLVNFACSFVFCFGLFGIIGHMAVHANSDVEQLLRSKEGLLFSVLAQAAAEIMDEKTMGFLFFGMVTLVGLNSTATLTVTLLTAVWEGCPKLRRHPRLLLGTSVSAMFVASFICASRLGLQTIVFLDSFVWFYTVPALLAVHVIIISVFYGPLHLLADFRYMVNNADYSMSILFSEDTLGRGWFKYYLILSWGLVAPLGLVLLVAFNYASISAFSAVEGVKVGGAVAGLSLVLGCWVYRMFLAEKRLSFRELFLISPEWGPVAFTPMAWDQGLPPYNPLQPSLSPRSDYSN